MKNIEKYAKLDAFIAEQTGEDVKVLHDGVMNVVKVVPMAAPIIPLL